MKTAFTILLVFVVVLACGCTTQTPASSPVATANTTIPDLTGIWSGTSIGNTHVEGFVDYPTTLFNISAQKSQVFTGRKEYPRMDGMTHYENFSGFLTTKGEIYESDDLGGIAIGTLTSPNSMELNYVEDGPDAKALIIRLTRQKG